LIVPGLLDQAHLFVSTAVGGDITLFDGLCDAKTVYVLPDGGYADSRLRA